MAALSGVRRVDGGNAGIPGAAGRYPDANRDSTVGTFPSGAMPGLQNPPVDAAAEAMLHQDTSKPGDAAGRTVWTPPQTYDDLVQVVTVAYEMQMANRADIFDVLIPYRRLDPTTAAPKLRWVTWIFDKRLPESAPLESMPPLVESRREERTGTITRKHLGVKIEHDMLSTAMGAQNLGLQLLNMSGMVAADIRRDRIESLLNAKQFWRSRLFNTHAQAPTLRGFLASTVSTWGIVTKGARGFALLDASVTSMMGEEDVTPTTWIMPKGSSIALSLVQSTDVEYYRAGARGAAAITGRNAPPLASGDRVVMRFRDKDVVELNTLAIEYLGEAVTNPMVRVRECGEQFPQLHWNFIRDGTSRYHAGMSTVYVTDASVADGDFTAIPLVRAIYECGVFDRDSGEFNSYRGDFHDALAGGTLPPFIRSAVSSSKMRDAVSMWSVPTMSGAGAADIVGANAGTAYRALKFLGEMPTAYDAEGDFFITHGMVMANRLTAGAESAAMGGPVTQLVSAQDLEHLSAGLALIDELYEAPIEAFQGDGSIAAAIAQVRAEDAPFAVFAPVPPGGDIKAYGFGTWVGMRNLATSDNADAERASRYVRVVRKLFAIFSRLYPGNLLLAPGACPGYYSTDNGGPEDAITAFAQVLVDTNRLPFAVRAAAGADSIGSTIFDEFGRQVVRRLTPETIAYLEQEGAEGRYNATGVGRVLDYAALRAAARDAGDTQTAANILNNAIKLARTVPERSFAADTAALLETLRMEPPRVGKRARDTEAGELPRAEIRAGARRVVVMCAVSPASLARAIEGGIDTVAPINPVTFQPMDVASAADVLQFAQARPSAAALNLGGGAGGAYMSAVSEALDARAVGREQVRPGLASLPAFNPAAARRPGADSEAGAPPRRRGRTTAAPAAAAGDDIYYGGAGAGGADDLFAPAGASYDDRMRARLPPHLEAGNLPFDADGAPGLGPAITARWDALNIEGNDLARISAQLCLMQEPNAKIFERWARNGMLLPMQFKHDRHSQKWQMGSGICLQGGAQLAQTYYGRDNWSFTYYGGPKTYLGHFTAMYKTHINNPKYVYVAPDIVAIDYVDGENVSFIRPGEYDPTNPHSASIITRAIGPGFRKSDIPDPCCIVGKVPSHVLHGAPAPLDLARIEEQSMLMEAPYYVFAYGLDRLVRSPDVEDGADGSFAAAGGERCVMVYQGCMHVWDPATGQYSQRIDGTGHWGPDVQRGFMRYRKMGDFRAVPDASGKMRPAL